MLAAEVGVENSKGSTANECRFYVCKVIYCKCDSEVDKNRAGCYITAYDIRTDRVVISLSAYG